MPTNSLTSDAVLDTRVIDAFAESLHRFALDSIKAKYSVQKMGLALRGRRLMIRWIDYVELPFALYCCNAAFEWAEVHGTFLWLFTTAREDAE